MKLLYTEFQQWLQQLLAAGISTTIKTTGDLDAAGGYWIPYGPFVRDNVAASLTDSRVALGATGATVLEAAVLRAGSLVGITCSFITAPPAGGSLTVSVFKGTAAGGAMGLLHATAILTVPAGAPLGYSVPFAKDNANLLFAAGDRVGIAITTPAGWSAITADIAVYAIIEG